MQTVQIVYMVYTSFVPCQVPITHTIYTNTRHIPIGQLQYYSSISVLMSSDGTLVCCKTNWHLATVQS